MLKKIFAMLVLAIVVFASFGQVAAKEISNVEAEKIAADYAHEGEITHTEVTVYHQGRPYYAVGFLDEAGRGRGYMIVDANSGDIVIDENTSREIFYAVTMNMGPDFRPEGINETLAHIANNQETIAEFEGLIDEMKALMKEPDFPYSCKKPTDEWIKAIKTLVADTQRDTKYLEKIYELQKSLADELETKKVGAFVAQNDECVDFIETTMLADFDKFKNASGNFWDAQISEAESEVEKAETRTEKETSLTGYEEMIQGIKDRIDLWRQEEKWVIEGKEEIYGVNWLMGNMHERLGLEAYKPPTPSPTPSPTPTSSPTPTPTPSSTPAPTPGFELAFAIAGLLAMAYLLRRRE